MSHSSGVSIAIVNNIIAINKTAHTIFIIRLIPALRKTERKGIKEQNIIIAEVPTKLYGVTLPTPAILPSIMSETIFGTYSPIKSP